MQRKSLPVAYVLWCVLGTLGIHRLYLRDYGWALIYACTGGLFLIGWFADAFLMPGKVEEANRQLDQDLRIPRAQLMRQRNPIRLPGWGTGWYDHPRVNGPVSRRCFDRGREPVERPAGGLADRPPGIYPRMQGSRIGPGMAEHRLPPGADARGGTGIYRT